MNDPQEDYKKEIEDLPEFKPRGCFLFWPTQAIDQVHWHLQAKHPAAYNAGYARGRTKAFLWGVVAGVVLAAILMEFLSG